MSTQSYKLKKKFTLQAKTLERNTIFLLILTIMIMTLTNSLSNTIILIGVFTNIPTYDDSKFRTFLMLGLTLGLILQPNQFLYFVLVVGMLYIRGRNYKFT